MRPVILLALLGCAGSAPQGRSTAAAPEVRTFEAQLAACDEEGPEAEAACQEALIAAAMCTDGHGGPICDHLRRTGALPPEPPPIDELMGCWSVIEPWDALPTTAERRLTGSPPPAAMQLCLETDSVLIGRGMSWDRLPVGEAAYVRRDRRDLAGYAVRDFLLYPIDGELALVGPGTLTRARLRRSTEDHPPVPAIDAVCDAARRCLEAWAASQQPAPAGDEEGMDYAVDIETDSARGCHCQLVQGPTQAMFATYGITPWDDYVPPTPPECDLDQLPYDASALGRCPP